MRRLGFNYAVDCFNLDGRVLAEGRSVVSWQLEGEVGHYGGVGLEKLGLGEFYFI